MYPLMDAAIEGDICSLDQQRASTDQQNAYDQEQIDGRYPFKGLKDEFVRRDLVSTDKDKIMADSDAIFPVETTRVVQQSSSFQETIHQAFQRHENNNSKLEQPLEDIYSIERIKDHRIRARKREFLINLLDYPESESKLEPEENIFYKKVIEG